MTEYRRFQHFGGTWFFTVNLAERRGNRLLVEQVDILRAAFAHVKQQRDMVRLGRSSGEAQRSRSMRLATASYSASNRDDNK